MAAKIGILGESTTTATGTVTLYTVPADKSARIRMIFALEGGATRVRYNLIIGSPNDETTLVQIAEVNTDLWSGSFKETTADPLGSILSGITGMHLVAGVIDMSDLTFDSSHWQAPLPADFFLSTGDTVKLNINNASPLDHLTQVIGVEDDA